MAVNFDVTLNGRGLLDYGLYGNTVDGLGLQTFGFVWLCSSIWDNADEAVTTSWSACTEVPGTNLEACDDE